MIKNLVLVFILMFLCSFSFGEATAVKSNKIHYVKDTTKKVTEKRKSGTATWYGDYFHGKKTANGEIYDMYDMTCATKNRSIPFGTKIEVTCVETGKKVVVRVNDRMASINAKHVKTHHDIDLSIKAFKKIAPLNKGVLTVKYKFLN